MPNYTPNYNLKKPLQTENYNIDDANGNMDIVDSAIKNVEDVVFKYQDPVVVGNLIKVNNIAGSERIYFKLSADISGDSILISTDDGVTSKPLKEIDGTSVTSLEAGFTEVVADATFFTLRNRGISAKDRKALIDIVNSGLINESTLKDEIIKALNLVNTEGEKIPTGGLWGDILTGIPKLKTGKNVKTGTAIVGTDRKLIVIGLPFKPSRIFTLNRTTLATGTYYDTSITTTGSEQRNYFHRTLTQTDGTMWEVVGETPNASGSYVKFGEFNLSSTYSGSVDWYAFE